MALPDSPQTREEEYLAHAATGGGTIPEYPVTREEQYLNKIATGDGAVPNTPLTRKEMYLAEIAENGSGGETVLINNKNISANGEYSASSDDADGYKKVTVSVPNTYAAADEGKVVSSGALVSQTAHAQVTTNGVVDTTLNNSVEVAVPEKDLSAFDYALCIEESGTVAHHYGLKTNYVKGQGQVDVYPNTVTKIKYESSIKYIYLSPYSFANITSIEGGENVEEIDAGANGFRQCSGLTNLYFPKLKLINKGLFRQCTGLQNVQFGSIGYGLTSPTGMVFQSCAQAGLTITIFSTGANVDATLSNIRNGATNATIIVKASEATTYGGNSYAAGDTILTSTP